MPMANQRHGQMKFHYHLEISSCFLMQFFFYCTGLLALLLERNNTAWYNIWFFSSFLSAPNKAPKWSHGKCSTSTLRFGGRWTVSHYLAYVVVSNLNSFLIYLLEIQKLPLTLSLLSSSNLLSGVVDCVLTYVASSPYLSFLLQFRPSLVP